MTQNFVEVTASFEMLPVLYVFLFSSWVIVCGVKVASHLQEASRADVNSSMSAAVEEMKQQLTARIQALELLVSLQLNSLLSSF